MFVRKLRAGDKVLLRENVEVEVRGVILGELPMEGDRLVAYLHDTTGKQWTLHPGDVVELLHRLRPEGKTEKQMALETMWEIIHIGEQVALHSPLNIESAIGKVHELVEVYKLGLPFDTASSSANASEDKQGKPPTRSTPTKATSHLCGECLKEHF